jgi:16S rRNA (cytosine1402-N4)-methyltransferase
MEFKHISVLLDESINALSVKHIGTYVDGTLGGGGHSLGILSMSDSCRLIGIDRDSEAIAAAKERLKDYENRVIYKHGNYSEIKKYLQEENIEKIDGAILDLGVSSYQLDNGERGFSYNHDARLDMRMDRNQELTAYDVVNTYDKYKLADVFKNYGEEKFAMRIAQKAVEYREKKPIETCFELVDIIKAGIPNSARREGGHPAKRVFQAIRIEVNNELGLLKKSLEDFFDCLKPGGRLAIITFHSLEDRIVKTCFADFCKGCICPPDFPVCVCNNKPKGKLVNKKPIIASREEQENNSRSTCAKLRIIEKL